MTIGSDLLKQHFETLVADNGRWQSLIADDLEWDLVYAPSLGHPARLSGRAEVMHHVTWFLSAVTYLQEYVVFLHSKAGRITHLREYFDPVRAARALGAPISLN